MATLTYYVGGRLGDVFHSMWVVNRLYYTTGRKGIVVFTYRYGGDQFSRGLRETFLEVRPFLENQEYIESVQIDESHGISPSLPQDAINLNAWRNDASLFHVDWTSLLSKVYGLDRVDPKDGWIRSPDVRQELAGEPLGDCVIVHQAYRSRINPTFNWDPILRQNKCIFVTCNKIEYDDFKHKDLVPVYVALDISELASIIAGAKGFVGNQSAPLAIATALGKICYCQLYRLDRQHYVGLGSHVFYEDHLPPPEIIRI